MSAMEGVRSSVYVIANPPPMSSISTAMPWSRWRLPVSATKTSSSRMNGSDIGDLRADVGMHTEEANVRERGRGRDRRGRGDRRHPERRRLVAGGDGFVRVDVNAGVHPEEERLHGSYDLTGVVVPGSIHHRGSELDFRVADRDDRKASIPVRYTGEVPDPFRDGREVIVTGKVEDGTFIAERDSLVTKCPSKFQTEAEQDPEHVIITE